MTVNYTLTSGLSVRVTHALYSIPLCSSFLRLQYYYRSTSEFRSAGWHVRCLAISLRLGCALCLTLSPCGRKSATKNSSISGIKNKTRATKSAVVHSGPAFDRRGNGLFPTQSQPPHYQNLSYIRRLFVVALIVLYTVAVHLISLPDAWLR